jgi:hypothetical protein
MKGHCERPAFARYASYGGFEVRRSAEREGGSEAIQGLRRSAWDSWIASSAFGLLAMTI